MRTLWLKTLLPLALSVNLSPAFAAGEHQHAGDIQPWKENGQIELNATLFEADFGDLFGGSYRTDDPGYDADTDHGAFGAGNWLWFQGIGSLRFWNGSAWSNAVPNGEHIDIDDALGYTSIFSTAGISNATGVIGEFDSFGDLHEHLDMAIRDSSNALVGSTGAYWITLSLFETAPNSQVALATSSNFDIIFNRGLSEANYEAAVAAVPLPAAVWMFGSALMGWLWSGRRRYAVDA